MDGFCSQRMEEEDAYISDFKWSWHSASWYKWNISIIYIWLNFHKRKLYRDTRRNLINERFKHEQCNTQNNLASCSKIYIIAPLIPLYFMKQPLNTLAEKLYLRITWLVSLTLFSPYWTNLSSFHRPRRSKLLAIEYGDEALNNAKAIYYAVDNRSLTYWAERQAGENLSARDGGNWK